MKQTTDVAAAMPNIAATSTAVMTPLGDAALTIESQARANPAPQIAEIAHTCSACQDAAGMARACRYVIDPSAPPNDVAIRLHSNPDAKLRLKMSVVTTTAAIKLSDPM